MRYEMLTDNTLHLIAYLALRVTSPLRAKRWTDRVGKLCSPIETADDAFAMAARLGRHGTCLSRSMALSARWPGSQVVIGVAHTPGDVARRELSLDAHAWVELHGLAVMRGDNAHWAELGRLGFTPRRRRDGGEIKPSEDRRVPTVHRESGADYRE